MKHLLAVSSVAVAVSVAAVGAQHHARVAPQHPAQHAAVAHDFNHSKVSHHFHLYQDGGAIEVVVKDAKDHSTLEALRQHLSTLGREPHVPGHSTQPHDASRTHVQPAGHDAAHAGMAGLPNFKGKVAYSYSETDRGGRLRLETTDPEALSTVHAFLRQQIQQHKTGDPDTIRKR